MPVPTDTSWSYFLEHHDAIRAVCQQYLPRPHMEVPNTRVHIQIGEGSFMETDQRATVPLKVTHTIEDFDGAVKARDSIKLTGIMNRAWLALPESRSIYREPGVTEMCNLLDCTVDGFFEDPEDHS